MTHEELLDYIADDYNLKASNDKVRRVASMAIEGFGGAKPWSWACQETTKTTDSNGVIVFDSDFDGVITMRERDSSSGGWIYPWGIEKFDYQLPRLDNLSGSYAKTCKIYMRDGEYNGQIAPPVSGQTIYINYKRIITTAGDIPNKFIRGVIALVHTFMLKPENTGYRAAFEAYDLIVKRLWKDDRVNWARIFESFDEENVREYVTWWGVWNW